MTDKKFAKSKTSLAGKSGGPKRIQSANLTSGSYMSVKERALARFDNCKFQSELQNVQSQSMVSIDELDPDGSVRAKWEARKIGPFSFDIDDEIQVPGC